MHVATDIEKAVTLYDAIAVNIRDHTIEVLAENLSANEALRVVNAAVHRQGCDERFFVDVEHGTFKDGDRWGGTPAPCEVAVNGLDREIRAETGEGKKQ